MNNIELEKLTLEGTEKLAEEVTEKTVTAAKEANKKIS